ncbi:probable ribosomal protein S11, mitochondrial [Argentina anserina]|uniref:probable ribosomal protein S11, mitochondrial n=1 Tax=Argentina anserina TaxID=57926 RepID=UPI0021768548|nr:probable ribosomal protein S11, mitochondrial [Potentilla anserina]
MFSSLSRLVPRHGGDLTALRSFSSSIFNFSPSPPPPPGLSESFQQGANASENVRTRREFDNDSGFPRRNSRSMNFVREIIDQDESQNRGNIQFQVPTRHIEQNADVVHIKILRNNTFVTVTDSKGNKKLGASAGSVPEMKGGAKLSRYAAEATAEYVGRMSRNFGLKSVVMRVKGFCFFKKKKTAILSWNNGYTNSRVGQNPIAYIEDITRKPHNGCRLRKQRRT